MKLEASQRLEASSSVQSVAATIKKVLEEKDISFKQVPVYRNVTFIYDWEGGPDYEVDKGLDLIKSMFGDVFKNIKHIEEADHNSIRSLHFETDGIAVYWSLSMAIIEVVSD